MPALRLTLLAVLAAALLAAPATSHAATVTYSGDVLTFTAGPGEENNTSLSIAEPGFCTVRPDPCFLVSEGTRVPIASFPPGDCTATDSPSAVECRIPASTVVNLGDGNDTLFDWQGPTTADGGPGNDGLDGNGGNDTLRGAGGNDSLFGEAGDDRLEGGDGDDAFEGFGTNSGDATNDTSGRDQYAGGAGTDLVDYTLRTDPLTIDTDGAADDGGAGEGDTVGADVERVYGGSGDDTLTGNAAPNLLYGYGGNDTLRSGAGDDMLKGGEGADQMLAEAGTDSLEGEAGDDTLDGGPGVDAFDADGPFSGNDTVLARDGASETINCGLGSDRAVVDRSDVTVGVGGRACEVIELDGSSPDPNPNANPTPGPTVDRTAPVLSGLAARASSRRRLAIRFRLSEAATVTVRLQRRVGRRYRTVRGQLRHSGRPGANTLRFSGRLAGRRVRPGRYRLVVTARDAAGNQATARRLAVRLRR